MALAKTYEGTEASVYFPYYKFDGSIFEAIKSCFGAYSGLVFKAMQTSLSDLSVTLGLNLDTNNLKKYRTRIL